MALVEGTPRRKTTPRYCTALSWSPALNWWTAPWSRMIRSSMCLSSPSNLVFSRECQLPPTVSRTHHCSSGCLPGYALPKNTKYKKTQNKKYNRRTSCLAGYHFPQIRITKYKTQNDKYNSQSKECNTLSLNCIEKYTIAHIPD